MATNETLDGQVADLFPLDGPHNDETTRAAGQAILSLVGYLNHATWHAGALPCLTTVDSLLGSLGAAVAGLGQLVRQVDRRVGQLAAPGDASAVGAGLDDALKHLGEIGRALSAAGGHVGCVGETEG